MSGKGAGSVGGLWAWFRAQLRRFRHCPRLLVHSTGRGLKLSCALPSLIPRADERTSGRARALELGRWRRETRRFLILFYFNGFISSRTLTRRTRGNGGLKNGSGVKGESGTARGEKISARDSHFLRVDCFPLSRTRARLKLLVYWCPSPSLGLTRGRHSVRKLFGFLCFLCSVKKHNPKSIMDSLPSVL